MPAPSSSQIQAIAITLAKPTRDHGAVVTQHRPQPYHLLPNSARVTLLIQPTLVTEMDMGELAVGGVQVQLDRTCSFF